MKAYRLPRNDLLEIRELDKDGTEKRLQNSPLFKRFIAVIGWLDPKGADLRAENWLSVIGEEEGGDYMVWAEVMGSLPKLAADAINLKDLLLISRIYVSGKNAQGVLALRRIDGLTKYEWLGTDRAGNKIWANKAEVWPHFRDYETTASLITIPQEITADMGAGYELIRQLDAHNKFTVRWACPRSLELLKQGPPYDRTIEHPLGEALISGFVMLERTKQKETTRKKERKQPVYGNLKRG